jgi:hypothetical protein
MKKFIKLAQTIYDVTEDFKENGEDYFGFDYPEEATDGKVWKFQGIDNGKVWARINTSTKELHICIYEKYYSHDPLIDIGIPIEKIDSKDGIIEAVKEELDLILTHFEMLMNEIEENE